MSISPELFEAILAMDAYNRGYARKLEVAGNQIGTASLGIGDDSPAAQAVSFFAQAYTLSNGQTVISFRGTDNPLGDLLTGWLGGIGFQTPQATLAISFYRSIVQQPVGRISEA